MTNSPSLMCDCGVYCDRKRYVQCTRCALQEGTAVNVAPRNLKKLMLRVERIDSRFIWKDSSLKMMVVHEVMLKVKMILVLIQHEGLIYVEDEIREDAAHVVQTLTGEGINVYLLSGDKKSLAEYFASVVGIPKNQNTALQNASVVGPDARAVVPSRHLDYNELDRLFQVELELLI
ncbi:copper-transporting ATPase PAA1, chloroplastic [Tanacetum coccineum]